jgi:hypothetical protein
MVRAVAAVDSGQAVNPDGIANQIEGAILQSMRIHIRPQTDHQYRLVNLSNPALQRRHRCYRGPLFDPENSQDSAFNCAGSATARCSGVVVSEIRSAH